MINPASAGFFVFGAVRFACRMAAAPYPAYGVARCRTGDWFCRPDKQSAIGQWHVARFNIGRWFRKPDKRSAIRQWHVARFNIGRWFRRPDKRSAIRQWHVARFNTGRWFRRPDKRSAIRQRSGSESKGYKKKIAEYVGEGLLVAALLALRVVACDNALSRCSSRTFSSFPEWRI